MRAEIELTDLEKGTLDEMIGKEDPFLEYFEAHIITPPTTHPLDQNLAIAAFLIGGMSAFVNFFIGKKCARILGAKSTLATSTGFGVVIPSIALEGNALHDFTLETMHQLFREKAKLPQKNNRRHLRRLAKSFVYISNIALGILAAYIHMNFLKAPLAVRYALLPGNFISNTVVNIQPFGQLFDDLFARYSPGLTDQTQLKRKILTASLTHALTRVHSYNEASFTAFYRAMTAPAKTPAEIKERWETLLKLDDQKNFTVLKKSLMTQIRGGVGILMSALCTLTNISVCYEAADWLADVFGVDNIAFSETTGLFLSVLCSISYGVLCAGPTQRAFEGEDETLGWQPTHPTVRKCMKYIVSPVLGGLNAAVVAFWPLYFAHHTAEKALSGPAFVSAGALFRAALFLLLNRLIDAHDRWKGNATPSNHLQFLAALDTLTRAVAQLPDDMIEALLPNEHPLFVAYTKKP